LVFKAPQGFLFQVYEDTKAKTVWLDISHSSPGLIGSRIYQAIADSAFNRRWVFKGDPQGLSQVALVRRTENMLSSAIRHGTTDHLEPHDYQLSGDAALGVPPLRWRSGDTLANVQALIETSVANLRAVWPDIDRYDYDFERRAFRTAEGKPESDGDVARWRAARPDGTASARRAGTRRGVLLNALSRRARREGPELFQSLVRLRSELRGAPQRDIFYSVAPVAVPHPQTIRASLRDRIRAATTQAMPALLATVPLRPLLTEIARDIPSAREYLRQKQAMDTLRDEWHAKTDAVAQKWRNTKCSTGPRTPA
jgi:hypothetical protein